VLYLDRPRWKAGWDSDLFGRFRYNDLKEAALSGAAALWALNVGGVLLEGWDAWIRVWRECSKRVWVEADVVRGVP
jgi:hypothetical protein